MSDLSELIEPNAPKAAYAASYAAARQDNTAVLLASIAISLKRIADAIEGNETKLGLAQEVGAAIGDRIFGASTR